jgi:hypothetical protein
MTRREIDMIICGRLTNSIGVAVLIVLMGSFPVVAVAGAIGEDGGLYATAPDSPPVVSDEVVDVDSPCSDPLFLALCARPLDELSEREYAYFVQKSAACEQYMLAEMAMEPSNELAKSTSSMTKAYIVISAIGLLITVLAYSSI